MKDFKTFPEIKDSIRENFSGGFNKIDPKEFRIGHACGYFIPNRQIAQSILTKLRAEGKKCKCIDTEYVGLQKKGIITDFWYPAIVSLNLPEAKKGFTYSNHKLMDNQKFY